MYRKGFITVVLHLYISSPGTLRVAANAAANCLAHSMQSSIVAFCTGMKGQTSSAPNLGCSPVTKTVVHIAAVIVRFIKVMMQNTPEKLQFGYASI